MIAETIWENKNRFEEVMTPPQDYNPDKFLSPEFTEQEDVF